MAYNGLRTTLGILHVGPTFNFFIVVALLVPSLSPDLQFCHAQSLAGNSSATTDAQALLAFQAEADRDGVLSSSWREYTDPCGNKTAGVRPWRGIQCNNRGRVFSVFVEGMQLVGSVSENSLSRLDQLRYLSLSRNFFSGSLPTDLSRLSKLTELWADDTQLSGPFPNFLTTGAKSHLALVSLSGNNFTGDIPDLTGVQTLATLNLSRNSFTGSIPVLPSQLQNLDLANNSLSGSVPSYLPATLKNLSLSVNHLSGVIPSDVAQKFPSSSFAGNDGLCGSPLANPCPSPNPSPSPAPADPPTQLGHGPNPSRAPSPTTSPFSSIGSRGHSSNKLSIRTIVIIVVADTAVLLLVLAGGLTYFRRRYKTKSKDENGKDGKSHRDVKLTGGIGTPEAHNTRLVFLEDDAKCNFDLDVLLRASAEMLGKGSFGTAYRAVLENGMVVTVKRLRDVKEITRDKFERQMEFIGNLRHPNVVPLRAYYYAKDENLIVYDFMPGGSLSSLLHGNGGSGKSSVDWDLRLQVAYGVASGLAFLHEEGHAKNVAHGNIKSSNILIGKDSEVYIADFGLVPLMAPAMAAQRTAGYRAPEYNHLTTLSKKADVYSFGVLLLELLTGRQPALTSQDGIDLPKWVQSMLREEWTGEVFDLELRRSTPAEDDMVSLLQIAMACVVTSPDQRPLMAQVVQSIEKIRCEEEEEGDAFEDTPSPHSSITEESS